MAVLNLYTHTTANRYKFIQNIIPAPILFLDKRGISLYLRMDFH